jgi:hypothetical protein
MPAIEPYPMQMVRVRSSKTVAPPIARIPRPRHATGAECCSSLCRIAGEVVLNRQAPGR